MGAAGGYLHYNRDGYKSAGRAVYDAAKTKGRKTPGFLGGLRMAIFGLGSCGKKETITEPQPLPGGPQRRELDLYKHLTCNERLLAEQGESFIVVRYQDQDMKEQGRMARDRADLAGMYSVSEATVGRWIDGKSSPGRKHRILGMEVVNA